MSEQEKPKKEVTIEDLDKRLKRMEVSGHIQTAVVILAFLGVVTLGALFAKGKKILNGKS